MFVYSQFFTLAWAGTVTRFYEAGGGGRRAIPPITIFTNPATFFRLSGAILIHPWLLLTSIDCARLH